MAGFRNPIAPPPTKFGPGGSAPGTMQAKLAVPPPPPTKFGPAAAAPGTAQAKRAAPPPPPPVVRWPGGGAETVQAKAAMSPQPAMARVAAPVPAPSRPNVAMPRGGAVAQKMMDASITSGFSAFSRPDFRSGVGTVVTQDVNQTLTSTGFNPVVRKDFDVAHKVPFEAIRNKVMSYVYYAGSTDKQDLIAKTDVLYTQNTTRYPDMFQKRKTLFKLIDHYGFLQKGPTLIMDAANALLYELNSAYDNLGLGFPSENRSLGPRPDPVITAWDPMTSTITYSPRTDAIDDEWNLTGNLVYDSSGHPRSSQVTSYFY